MINKNQVSSCNY